MKTKSKVKKLKNSNIFLLFLFGLVCLGTITYIDNNLRTENKPHIKKSNIPIQPPVLLTNNNSYKNVKITIYSRFIPISQLDMYELHKRVIEPMVDWEVYNGNQGGFIKIYVNEDESKSKYPFSIEFQSEKGFTGRLLQRESDGHLRWFNVGDTACGADDPKGCVIPKEFKEKYPDLVN